MFKEHAALDVRADDCVAQARVATKLAEKAATDGDRSSYLRVAMDWMILARELDRFGEAVDDATTGPTPGAILAPVPGWHARRP